MIKIDKLIINSPYETPKQHWGYDREVKEFKLKEERRSAGYLLASPKASGHDDPGLFHPIELVNQIRPFIDKWRANEWSGATGVTKELLRYWYDKGSRSHRFFFCQLEAIETLMWLCETEDPNAKQMLKSIQGDGSAFARLCSKMATGTGKTIVMAMINSWQILNKVDAPDDNRFSKNILIVAPGLTVKNRLEVLYPDNRNNYYKEFKLIPGGLIDKLNQGNIIIHNWHSLSWESVEKINKKLSVDKRGAKSDNAYVKDILKPANEEREWIVINDEAHHAWRDNPTDPHKGTKAADNVVEPELAKENKQQATVWIQGLDRIHNARKIKYCFDMSATPYAPSGGKNYEEALYNWIVSDFGLNDAIEAGLVKTPRVVIRDNSKRRDENYKSRLFHIYMDPEVRPDLSRNNKKLENESLPNLVKEAYSLMASDWKVNFKAWQKAKKPVPPVMISVANNTITAARIRKFFNSGELQDEELSKPHRTLQIDSKVLKNAEQADQGYDLVDQGTRGGKITPKEREDALRRQVSTIGVMGQPGEQICNIISVDMLSEGWDAKTVTNIIGLRAFSSQLLCEQVIGRGLRRSSYVVEDDGLFAPEYVNIFGVPFTFIPHEEHSAKAAAVAPQTLITPVDKKIEHMILWPDILNIAYKYNEEIKFNMKDIESVRLDPQDRITDADLAAILQGKTVDREVREINLRQILEEKRMNSYIFLTAKGVYDYYMNIDIESTEGQDIAYDLNVMRQLIHIVKNFIVAGKIEILRRLPSNKWEKYTGISNYEDKKVVFADLYSARRVIAHIAENITKDSVDKKIIIYDNPKTRCTLGMPDWYTKKPCADGKKSHINFTVFDSRWEDSYAYMFDKDKRIKSYVKNDVHVAFKIFYRDKSIVRIYLPDYIVELNENEKGIDKLIIEVKGREWPDDSAKEKAVEEWVEAVNESGEWGKWAYRKFDENPALQKEII